MNRKWIGLAVILLAAAALVEVGVLHFRHERMFPATDDAYVNGDRTAVASRVPGVLLEVRFQDHQRVEAGQVLAVLDPAEFDRAVAVADAGVARAEASQAEIRARIAATAAQVTAAESERDQARADRDRFAALGDRGSVPTREAEQARTAAAVAAARVEALRKEHAAAQAALVTAEKALEKARAELAQAQLRRSYCTITAPCGGMVADKHAEVGQIAAVGQPLGTIVPLNEGTLWIDANFKETQLARIRPGQPVTIAVDALPDLEFHGTVAALSAGTGSAFSLLPTQNASGNWVKIVQRLPVRIDIPAGQPGSERLRLGLSSHVTVDTQGSGGSR